MCCYYTTSASKILFLHRLFGPNVLPPKEHHIHQQKTWKKIHVASQKEVMLKFPLILDVQGHLIIQWSSPPAARPGRKSQRQNRTARRLPRYQRSELQAFKMGPKTFMTFHYTGWLISILTMAYYNPNINGYYNPLYTTKKTGFWPLLTSSANFPQLLFLLGAIYTGFLSPGCCNSYGPKGPSSLVVNVWKRLQFAWNVQPVSTCPVNLIHSDQYIFSPGAKKKLNHVFASLVV